jgi:hypothetical protein
MAGGCDWSRQLRKHFQPGCVGDDFTLNPRASKKQVHDDI